MTGERGRLRLPGGDPDGAPFALLVDGERVEAYPGETIATALLAAGRRTLRRTARSGEPRGLYCVMGVCWECVVLVEGRSVRACLEPAAPGMRVATAGRPA
jgi:aerobic-type carbon monoxide dehydrogenase small subunit (CoxS/CutS family)